MKLERYVELENGIVVQYELVWRREE